MMTREDKNKKNTVDLICKMTSVLLILFACMDIVRFGILGDKTAFITFSMIAAVFILLAYTAGKSKMPFLYLLIAVPAFVLYPFLAARVRLEVALPLLLSVPVDRSGRVV